MQGAARVITLELRLDGQSPIGRASTPDNRERQFAGWLALIAAIDALATDDPNTGTGPSTQPTSNQVDIHDDTNRAMGSGGRWTMRSRRRQPLRSCLAPAAKKFATRSEVIGAEPCG
jgi:hypothetical protein